ncbi:MAG: zinc-binding dehydrogenase [SAR202 cluster bacterium]|nr:zinc-binding dehydrogenase [SAR202 cluster bacterium]
MRALALEQPGRPPTLRIREVPTPVPGPGEALVRVAACGFCHHDLLVMAGVLRRGVPYGAVLGHEISGTVEALGEGVTTVQPGQAVVSLLTSICGRCDRCRQGREHRCRAGQGIGHGRAGGFAEYVSVSAASLVLLPPGLDLTTACLLACPMGVAFQALESVAQVMPGETVLVTGAGGGLGSHTVQAAATLGARVLAVTSSPAKVPRLKALGAWETVEVSQNPDEGLDFSEVVLALTGDEGADVIIDTVGSPLFPSTWRCLGQYGRLALLGEVTGQPVALDLAEAIFRDARILGSSGVSRATLERVAELAAQGRLTPLVSHALPLEAAQEAFALLSSRSVLGRLVLTVQ